jgi:hypothetical protein
MAGGGSGTLPILHFRIAILDLAANAGGGSRAIARSTVPDRRFFLNFGAMLHYSIQLEISGPTALWGRHDTMPTSGAFRGLGAS